MIGSRYEKEILETLTRVNMHRAAIACIETTLRILDEEKDLEKIRERLIKFLNGAKVAFDKSEKTLNYLKNG